MYNLDELESICRNYDESATYNVNPIHFKKVLDDVGPINWAEFMTLQSLNMYFPKVLENTKFLNFTDVADPQSKVNRAIFNDCLDTSQKLSDGTFQSFKTRDVAWGFIHFILAYLQDIEINYSDDDISKIKEEYNNIHQQLLDKIEMCDPDTISAALFVYKHNPSCLDNKIVDKLKELFID